MAETDEALTIDDMGNRKRRLLGRVATQEALDLSAPQARRRLERSGVGEADITSILEANPNLAYEYLTNQAKKGPVAGRVSAARRADITAAHGMERLDEAAELARTNGLDSIAAMEGNFGQSLAALGGGPLDMNNPAVQAILARQVSARGESQQSMMNMIEQARVMGHNALEANADANVIPLLTDIGDTVAALEAMRDQEKAMLDAARGQMIGTVVGAAMGPGMGANIFGGLAGGAFGGSRGMYTGMEAGAQQQGQNNAMAQQVMSMFGGGMMGGMGGMMGGLGNIFGGGGGGGGGGGPVFAPGG